MTLGTQFVERGDNKGVQRTLGIRESVIPRTALWGKTHALSGNTAPFWGCWIHLCHNTPTSARDLSPFSKSLTSTSSLKLKHIRFTLLFGPRLLLGRQTVFSQNYGQGATQQSRNDLDPAENKCGNDSSATSAELQDVCSGIQNFSS
jgi:hypothetical protein